MPTAQEIQGVYEHYVLAWTNHDLDGLMTLFADSAVVHDPVDGPVREGAQSIREFFSLGIDAMRTCKLTSPIHISADCRHAAVAVCSEVDVGGELFNVEAIDTVTFDDDGRISEMTAYWGPTNMRSIHPETLS